MPTPIALTIATSDSSGGAGIQADLKTFSALGVYGASVLVALTAQNTRGVTAIHNTTPDFVAEQMDAVFDDLAIGGVKIGMLSIAPLIRAVADGLGRHRAANVVLDPVMVAASGARLLTEDAVEPLKRELLPKVLLVTPNLPEAAALLGGPMATDEAGMAEQGRRILELGPRAVLVKGGHGEGPESVDLLVDAAGVRRFSAPRVNTRNTHGTGCTLSAAIAAGLAKGLSLDESVGAAKTYLSAALAAADTLEIGSGHGPVHHFHAIWPKLRGNS
jgi:hydroxymethylpyrimidine/phosphomethylpyrimidine kinase